MEFSCKKGEFSCCKDEQTLKAASHRDETRGLKTIHVGLVEFPESMVQILHTWVMTS